MIRARPPYGSSCTCTRSPTRTLILCRRIFPARYARTSLSSPIFTRKRVLGRASSTMPSTTSGSDISARARIATSGRAVKGFPYLTVGCSIFTIILDVSVGNVLFQKGSMRACASWMLGKPWIMVWKALSSRPTKAFWRASESTFQTI